MKLKGHYGELYDLKEDAEREEVVAGEKNMKRREEIVERWS